MVNEMMLATILPDEQSEVVIRLSSGSLRILFWTSQRAHVVFRCRKDFSGTEFPAMNFSGRNDRNSLWGK